MNLIVSEVDMQTMTIKPGKRTARMQEESDKDCDPIYNAENMQKNVTVRRSYGGC